MLTRLLKADLARGAIVATTLTALIALAATLMSAGTSLVVDSLAATSRLSTQAKLPDLVQMHTGTVDFEAIDQWAAARSDIADHQVIKTLPVPRQELTINGRNQSESYNEPGRSSTSCRARRRRRPTAPPCTGVRAPRRAGSQRSRSARICFSIAS